MIDIVTLPYLERERESERITAVPITMLFAWGEGDREC